MSFVKVDSLPKMCILARQTSVDTCGRDDWGCKTQWEVLTDVVDETSVVTGETKRKDITVSGGRLKHIKNLGIKFKNGIDAFIFKETVPNNGKKFKVIEVNP